MPTCHLYASYMLASEYMCINVSVCACVCARVCPCVVGVLWECLCVYACVYLCDVGVVCISRVIVFVCMFGRDMCAHVR